ncbi:MAG TPA: SUMF1/EgtB/PvdO family nonheme iron enzyme [Capsulimonadaceae bacterium]|jgi:formylglycine-generating enzyme required for sulfatase activity
MKRHNPLLVALLCGALTFSASAAMQADTAKSRRIVLTGINSPSPDQQRMALVIGNTHYGGASELKNPENDARAVANTLQKIGFNVTLILDAGRDSLRTGVNDFARQVQDAGANTAAVMYYSGHGMEVNGKNYLVPIGFEPPPSVDDLDDYAYPVQRALDKMASARAKVSVVVLDACRNNPFSGTRAWGGKGLAVCETQGMYIAYATAAGATASDNGDGENGLYTQELLKNLSTPGLNIHQVFQRTRYAVFEKSGKQQWPYVYDGLLSDDFYFQGKPVTPVQPTPPPVPKPAPGPVFQMFDTIAHVNLTGVPDGATVSLDGVTQTGCLLDVDLGDEVTKDVRVVVRKPGYKTVAALVTLRPGVTADIPVKMDPLPGSATKPAPKPVVAAPVVVAPPTAQVTILPSPDPDPALSAAPAATTPEAAPTTAPEPAKPVVTAKPPAPKPVVAPKPAVAPPAAKGKTVKKPVGKTQMAKATPTRPVTVSPVSKPAAIPASPMVALPAPAPVPAPAVIEPEPTPAPTPAVIEPAPSSNVNPFRPQSSLRIGSTKDNTKDGAKLVFVPAGEFTMGTGSFGIPNAFLKDFKDAPTHTVTLDGFWVYQKPVTVAQYRAFCNETKRKMPGKPIWGWHDDHPMVRVSWNDAMAYAEWAGATLPTEAQWEKAARGMDGRAYPWGQEWDATLCSHSTNRPGDLGGTEPAGSYPDGASPYGALDMAGNVTQWCLDLYGDNYYTSGADTNPTGPTTGKDRVQRGASWSDRTFPLFRSAYRQHGNPKDSNDSTGFRCVMKAE